MTLTAALPPAPRRGRPPCCPPEVVTLVVALRRRGLSLAAIGAELNAQGVPTPAGRPRWTKSHVDRLLHTRHAQDLLGSQPPFRVLG
jgi:hypothetical protein